MNGLNFSPHFWWKSIERAVSFTEFFSKELVDGCNFRDWLTNEIIEHNDIDIYDESKNGPILTSDERYAVTNTYFFEVYTTNKYGHKITAQTIDGLKEKIQTYEIPEINYRFKIDELNHYATLHFQKWLILNKHFDWVRWQLYFDFITSKLDNYKKGLYIYYWSVFFNEVDFQTNFFTSVEHYKQFRDKLDEITKQSEYIVIDYRKKIDEKKENNS